MSQQPEPEPYVEALGAEDAYEQLLDQVWECEKEWRLDDRIDLALHIRRIPQ